MPHQLLVDWAGEVHLVHSDENAVERSQHWHAQSPGWGDNASVLASRRLQHSREVNPAHGLWNPTTWL